MRPLLEGRPDRGLVPGAGSIWICGSTGLPPAAGLAGTGLAGIGAGAGTGATIGAACGTTMGAGRAGGA